MHQDEKKNEDEQELIGNNNQTLSTNIKTFLKLATPFTLSTMIGSAGNFASARLLAQLGTDELAASGLITSAQLLMQGFLFSPLYAVGVYTGQAKGARDVEKVNASFQQGMLASFIFSVPMVTLAKFVGPIFKLTGQSDITANIAQQFFDGYVYGIWADVFLIAIQQHATALGEQNAVLISSLLQKIASVGLTAWLMLGSPQLSSLGMGYAYSASAAMNFIGLNIYLALRKQIDLPDFLSIENFRNRFQTLKDLMKIGLPISLQLGTELAVFTVLMAMSGDIDISQLTSAELVFQYYGFVLVPILGASQATGILVSQAIGDHNPRTANRYTNLAFAIGSIIPILAAILMPVLYKPLTDFFVSTSNSSSILDDSRQLFIISSLTILPDFFRNISTGALRGVFDTTVPMIINIVFSLLNLGLSYLGGFTLGFKNEGIYGARGICTLALALILTTRWFFKIKAEFKTVEMPSFVEDGDPLIPEEGKEKFSDNCCLFFSRQHKKRVNEAFSNDLQKPLLENNQDVDHTLNVEAKNFQVV